MNTKSNIGANNGEKFKINQKINIDKINKDLIDKNLKYMNTKIQNIRVLKEQILITFQKMVKMISLKKSLLYLRIIVWA